MPSAPLEDVKEVDIFGDSLVQVRNPWAIGSGVDNDGGASPSASFGMVSFPPFTAVSTRIAAVPVVTALGIRMSFMRAIAPTAGFEAVDLLL